MHSHQEQPRYAPSSVGVLIDPAFLRGVVIDANGYRRDEGADLPTLRLRLRGAMQAIAVAFRRP
ncbi:MAG: hypothetical protein ACXU7G_10815 [Croceibacterium sp.]